MNNSHIFKLSAIALSISLITACSDDDSTTAGPSLPSAGGEVGVFTINTSGANGNSLGGGIGGVGGNVSIMLNEGMEGRLEILDNGKVDASFTETAITANTGSTGEIISATTTISVVGAEPAVDVLYMVAGDTRLYKSDATAPMADPSEIVSGLTVDDGAILELELNNGGSADLTFTNDLLVNGTVTTVANGTVKGDLSLWAKNVITGSTASITTAGTDTTVVDGGNISVTADYTLSNKGSITSSGFTDTALAAATPPPVAGGNAGRISLTSVARTYNSGALTATGGTAGDATGNNGGMGGNITLSTTLGDLNNLGNINNSGGNADVVPGDGGNISLKVNSYGDLRNSANLIADGGISTTSNGGMGGSITLLASGGDLKNSGDLSSTGGSAADTMTGGDGGNISITSDWGDFESMPGNILLSGNMNTSGGAVSVDTVGGGAGGNGGSINIAGNVNASRGSTQLVGLWGYTAVTTNGGNGESGDSAGSFTMNTSTTRKNINIGSNIEWRSSGNVINEADIAAKGGDSTSTTVTSRRGGAGGTVGIMALNTTDVIGDAQTVTNSGDIVTSAGINHERTGGIRTSGSVTLDATGGVTNSGTMTTDGGSDNDITGVGRGNDANIVDLTSAAGTVRNSSVISAKGGDGQDIGGAGSDIFMMGVSVSNTANIATNGGNAIVAAGSTGGNAGKITLAAKTSGGVSDSGTHTQSGGTGETAGMDSVKYTYSSH